MIHNELNQETLMINRFSCLILISMLPQAKDDKEKKNPENIERERNKDLFQGPQVHPHTQKHTK